MKSLLRECPTTGRLFLTRAIYVPWPRPFNVCPTGFSFEHGGKGTGVVSEARQTKNARKSMRARHEARELTNEESSISISAYKFGVMIEETNF